MPSTLRARTVLLTALTLVAFAANSILCRMALRGGGIGPTAFTALRLASGAVMLLPWLLRRGAAERRTWRSVWAAPLALVVYALAFSLAFVELPAGTGALLLFGAVQVTMIGVGWARGERFGIGTALGVLMALAGVVLLVAPGVAAPDPLAALAMTVAGVGWGVYSLLGRGATAPARRTARNFLRAAPLGILVALLVGRAEPLEWKGASLALVSGAITSGLGYVIWYAALRGHSATSAAVVQLAVPALVAFGGVALLGEAVTARLGWSSALTLGGILLAILSKRTSASVPVRAS